MAILWQQNIEGSHYEVRTAGASIRLYRNGVNHSQWNPNRPLCGSIWDLIALPTLFRPEGSLEDVLILGFGAGAVGRQIQVLAKPERIIGVELDSIHLSIANGFFDCIDDCELVAADAVEWIHESAPDERYDVIIDDLYGESDGIPVRCVPMDVEWCVALADRLNPGGILIFNMIEPDKVSHLPIFKSQVLSDRFTETIMYRIDGYENRVIAFSDRPFDARTLRTQLNRVGKEYPRTKGVEARHIRCRNYRP